MLELLYTWKSYENFKAIIVIWVFRYLAHRNSMRRLLCLWFNHFSKCNQSDFFFQNTDLSMLPLTSLNPSVAPHFSWVRPTPWQVCEILHGLTPTFFSVSFQSTTISLTLFVLISLAVINSYLPFRSWLSCHLHR